MAKLPVFVAPIGDTERIEVHSYVNDEDGEETIEMIHVRNYKDETNKRQKMTHGLFAMSSATALGVVKALSEAAAAVAKRQTKRRSPR